MNDELAQPSFTEVPMRRIGLAVVLCGAAEIVPANRCLTATPLQPVLRDPAEGFFQQRRVTAVSSSF
jgi:hypothetical protein